MPHQSPQKKVWDDLYRSKHQADPEIITAWDLVPQRDGNPFLVVFQTLKVRVDRHHVFRRHKWQILLYRYVTRRLHDWIEAHSQKAREMGLLYRVEKGNLINPSPQDPFGILPEFSYTKDQFER